MTQNIHYTTEVVSALWGLNCKWFEAHKHLSNEEMLAEELIDECDVGWVNALRELEAVKE